MGLFDLFRKRPAPVPETETVPDSVPVVPVNRRMRPRRNARAGSQALIIDDSATIVAALGRILRSAQYNVLEAADAESGLEVARREVPDVIFLDIVLPGMNGFAALRQLRRDPQTMDIPIIMMSGNEQATEQFFGSRIGADDFMKKPFSRHEVFARVERMLTDDNRLRRPPRENRLYGARDDGLTSTELLQVPPLQSGN